MDTNETMSPIAPHAPLPPSSQTNPQFKLMVILGVFIFAFILYPKLASFFERIFPPPSSTSQQAISKFKLTPTEKVEAFSSVEDFKLYVANNSLGTYGNLGSARSNLTGFESVGIADSAGVAAPSALMNKTLTPDRYSTTNVQVTGIDEPDIVKTDGKNLYFSRAPQYQTFIDTSFNRFPVPAQTTSTTDVLSVFPPTNLNTLSQINNNGDLLLEDTTLVVISPDKKITGYSVKDPQNPSQTWQNKLADTQTLVAARLKAGRIYLVTSSSINSGTPCPYISLDVQGQSISIPCTSIFHPTSPVSVDTTYTLMALNIHTGAVVETSAFVASSDSSVVYMSPDALYLTYTYQPDLSLIVADFFSTTGSDLVSPDFQSRLKDLSGYRLSQAAKLTELFQLLESEMNSKTDSDRLKFQTELENRMKKYSSEHLRELEFTGIVKFNADNLKVSAVGRVPGRPLNQFSLDEYKDHLRIATTIGGTWFGMFGGSQAESVSDVYVLNNNLSESGVVKGLGETERIYSVRFVADRGYVVTFRQVDPFYILDLSRPNSPQKTGELKIPGYSSYLHPIGDNRVLGVGKEGSQVKVSLFDVSDAKNPREVSKYTLSEYWSEALTTHHAFLSDPKYQNFFIPGSQGAYVISYANDELKLLTAVSSFSTRRAIYISDYLYIISDSKIVVLSQRDGSTVKEFTLE